jgi:hypothetical protein
MKALSDRDIGRLSRKGKTERIRPVDKKPSVVPEDKQVKATNEMLAIVKEGNIKADRMANLTYSIADIFLKAVEKIRPQATEKVIKIKEWEFTVTERNEDKTIKRFKAKAI